jgi:hypothetical protein
MWSMQDRLCDDRHTMKSKPLRLTRMPNVTGLTHRRVESRGWVWRGYCLVSHHLSGTSITRLAFNACDRDRCRES